MTRMMRFILIAILIHLDPLLLAAEESCYEVLTENQLIEQQPTPFANIRQMENLPPLRSEPISLASKHLWMKITLAGQGCKELMYFQIPDREIERIRMWQTIGDRVIYTESYSAFENVMQYFPFRNIPTFDLDLSQEGATEIYLSIRSQNRLSLGYKILSSGQRIENEIITQVIFLLFFGITIGLTIYNFYLYAVTKDAIYMYFVGYALTVVIASTINEGNADFIFPIGISWYNFLNAITCLAVFLKLNYVREMLPLRVQAPGIDRFLILYAHSAWIVALVDMIPFFKYYTNLFMTFYLSMGTAVCMVAAILSYIRNYRPARILIVAWTITFLLVGLRFLVSIGQLEPSVISNHAYKLSLTIELFLLAVVLADKINTLQKELTRLNESLETKINNRTKQLKQANKRYKENQAYVIEQEKFAALGRIADALAHEVNTPLMIIRTGASILHRHSEDIQPQMVERRTSQIERAVDKIEKIIKALTITYLNPLGSQSGKEVDIGEYLQSIIDLHSGQCLQYEIDLKVGLPENLLIPGNPLHLADIISELFNGAIQAVANLEKKWIEINVARVKNDIVIVLKDSATTDQKDPRQTMFDEIESSYTENPIKVVDSVGIGVAHQIIRSYGGSLKFIQNPFYTQATIKFPIDLSEKKKRVA